MRTPNILLSLALLATLPLSAQKSSPQRSKASSAVEMEFWQSIRDSKDPDDFKAYIKKYPKGEFLDLAKNRLKGLVADSGFKVLPIEKQPRIFSAGEEWTDPTTGIVFSWIPPGSFLMGGNAPEEDRVGGDGNPLHKVTLSKGFWMARTELTYSQWHSVMGHQHSLYPTLFDEVGPNAPVENISWDECMQFCKRLNSAFHGDYFRLPTEAEWEYACRAGTTTSSYGPLDDIAWYEMDEDNSPQITHVVGQKKPNAWNLYDMLGNVQEYCSDWFAEKYPGKPQVDPKGPPSGTNRVARGGSIKYGKGHLLASMRMEVESNSKVNEGTEYVGLRVVLNQIPKDTNAKIQPMPISIPDFAKKKGIRPGQILDDDLAGMSFCWIPAGSFIMGSPGEETDFSPERSDEWPQHRVTISKGFWMGRTEVTQAQWQRFIPLNPSKFGGEGREWTEKAPNNPLDSVTRETAKAFVKLLNTQAGFEIYRLPTEAEWEYACRAGNPANRYGSLDEIAWHSGNSNRHTHPVAEKIPNAWGLFDMLGNVSEWVIDESAPYTKHSRTDPVNWQFSAYGYARGGSWYVPSEDIRAAFHPRSSPNPSFGWEADGFRIVRIAY